MAKYRRYRKYSRRAHGKWSPNITRLGPNTFNIGGQSREHVIHTLIENPVYENTKANNVLRTKNVECTIEFESPANTGSIFLESCTAYIMFLPEGYITNNDTPIQHPEWIMAYQFFGSPMAEYDEPQTLKPLKRIRSRLSRNLNTGDRIVLFIEGTNTANTTLQLQYQGLLRWWTKAN